MGRYEALYVGHVLDGIYDNEIEKFIDVDTVIKLLNSIDDDELKKMNEKYKKLYRQYRDDPLRDSAKKFLKIIEDGIILALDNLQERGVIQMYLEEAVKEVVEKEYGKKED